LSATSINRLFEIERTLGAVSPDERKAARLERSKPVLDEFKRWLDSASSKVLPKSALGEAVNYCQNPWPKLIVFLEDGRLELSNNRAERSTEPTVETANDNRLNPFAYPAYVFERLPRRTA